MVKQTFNTASECCYTVQTKKNIARLPYNFVDIMIKNTVRQFYRGACFISAMLRNKKNYPRIILCSELQIRGGTEDNSKIIFLISQGKHML